MTIGLAAAFFLAMAARASAHTITLSDTDTDMQGCPCSDAPRQSWAGSDAGSGIFHDVYIDLTIGRSYLIRYPLEKIPKGQRVTKAELLIPQPTYVSAPQIRLFAWRMLADWGPGVCHEFRMVDGNKGEPWAVPGGKGNASDRATAPTVVLPVSSGGGEINLNVTQDVELWYTGSTPNRGWMISLEDPDLMLRLNSPGWTAPGQWRLRITYEPE